jgi:hypothetical protein
MMHHGRIFFVGVLGQWAEQEESQHAKKYGKKSVGTA